MTSTAIRSSLLKLSLRAAIGAALLLFLFTRQADLSRVTGFIRNADKPILMLALFLAISGEILTAYKWRRLVSFIGGNLPILKAVKASFIGMFYNNFFPGSVGGDIARVLLVAREAGGKARATASAFMQRNTGLAALFLVGIPASFLWPRQFDWPCHNSNIPAFLRDCRPWLIGALAGFSMINAAIFSRFVYGRIWSLADKEESNLPKGRLHYWFRVLMLKLQRFHTELRGYRFWLFAPLLISVITQLTDIFMISCLARSIGLAVPFHVFLVVVPVVTIANLIPLTINGIGLRETLYVAMLHSAGVPADQAIALSLLQFSIMMILAAAGGLLQFASPVSTGEASPVR